MDSVAAHSYLTAIFRMITLQYENRYLGEIILIGNFVGRVVNANIRIKIAKTVTTVSWDSRVSPELIAFCLSMLPTAVLLAISSKPGDKTFPSLCAYTNSHRYFLAFAIPIRGSLGYIFYEHKKHWKVGTVVKVPLKDGLTHFFLVACVYGPAGWIWYSKEASLAQIPQCIALAANVIFGSRAVLNLRLVTNQGEVDFLPHVPSPSRTPSPLTFSTRVEDEEVDMDVPTGTGISGGTDVTVVGSLDGSDNRRTRTIRFADDIRA
ncbi:hypothetical protein CONPUDRAFT_76580 [Coniophora puteana RWD-64-598 SS2]|uniref:Uncharacterized protein n=1 Tax=Coniophora puteana (strain RWD-64-598) TaxID=741705 RepID=A0A5M3MC06_CONPW|nr:uncharacterized protein CONPUDRAFT_76580 [Coniophora puteana RWD-64-598 SS2]EIW76171.1 hypothetical protein CONPUDRAFT_76580 [Coniophora puteana RWD-64-598 SS2]